MDMKNSPFSSVTHQHRVGSLHRNPSLQHAYTDPVLERHHYSSTEDIKHERASSRDSSDYAYLISKLNLYIVDVMLKSLIGI